MPNTSPGNRNLRLGSLEAEAQRIAKIGHVTVSDVVRICLAEGLPLVESGFVHTKQLFAPHTQKKDGTKQVDKQPGHFKKKSNSKI